MIKKLHTRPKITTHNSNAGHTLGVPASTLIWVKILSTPLGAPTHDLNFVGKRSIISCVESFAIKPHNLSDRFGQNLHINVNVMTRCPMHRRNQKRCNVHKIMAARMICTKDQWCAETHIVHDVVPVYGQYKCQLEEQKAHSHRALNYDPLSRGQDLLL